MIPIYPTARMNAHPFSFFDADLQLKSARNSAAYPGCLKNGIIITEDQRNSLNLMGMDSFGLSLSPRPPITRASPKRLPRELLQSTGDAGESGKPPQ